MTDFEKHNVQIFGVSKDAPDSNQKFRVKHGFYFDLLSDIDNQMALDYGAVESTLALGHSRISYLIDEKGVVLIAYGKVSAAEHPQQVLDDLQQL